MLVAEFKSHRSLGGLLALVAALAVTLSACGSTAPGTPPRRVGPESIIQDDAQLRIDPAGTLATFKRLGVARVRTFLQWGTVAPDPSSTSEPRGFDASDPSAYPPGGWATTDTVVRDAAARGIGIDLTLTGPAPLWATGPGLPPGTAPGYRGVWQPSAIKFGDFVRAVGRRYSGSYTPPGASSPLPRVSFWAIWNEPNYGVDLAPQATDDSAVELSPALYRGLLDAAWSGLEATGHGPRSDTILIGELAPRGQTVGDQPGNFSGMVPLRFLRALYCLDSSLHVLTGPAAADRECPADAAGSSRFRADNPALFGASGFADHPYPQGLPPTVGTPEEPDYADLPALPALEHVLDEAQRAYGSSVRLPIYSTEFGYITNPPERILRAIPPTLAAYYLNWAEYISWRNPRIRSYDQYLLVDGTRGSFATGLELANGEPKATYAAYRMPIYLPVTVAARGHPLEVWGCVRPDHYARLQTRAPQEVAIQFRPRGGDYRTIKEAPVDDPYGYFDVPLTFPASGSVRLSWSYPGGPTIYSRDVILTIR